MAKHFESELTAYLAHFKHYKPLTKQEDFNRLFEVYRNGRTERARREARDALVYGNIRLVVWVSKQSRWHGLPMVDRVQEGVFGVIRALEDFNPAMGIRFSTYATHWIQHEIGRAVQNVGNLRPYRLPVHILEKVGAVRKIMAKFVIAEGHQPSRLEILAAVRKLDAEWAKEFGLAELVATLRVSQQGEALSLDAKVSSDEGDATLGDYVAWEPPSIEAVVDARGRLTDYRKALERVEEVLKTLSPRHAEMFRLRMGLGEFTAQTLDDVGLRFDVSRERVRQVEVMIFQVLKRRTGIGHTEFVEIIEAIEELSRMVAAAA